MMMNSVIDELFKKASSKDEKVSSNAVTDLCVILEMNSWRLSQDDRISRYSSYVSQEVIEVELDETSQAEIVKFLHDEIVKGSKLTVNLLFAMGQASANIGLIPLIDIIEKFLNGFNENEVYQALIALERLMYFDESLSLEEEKQIIAKTNLLRIISQKILSLQPIYHSDLESTALRLLARLIVLLDND